MSAHDDRNSIRELTLELETGDASEWPLTPEFSLELTRWCLERGLTVQLLRAANVPTTIRFVNEAEGKLAKVLFADRGLEELMLRTLIAKGLF